MHDCRGTPEQGTELLNVHEGPRMGCWGGYPAFMCPYAAGTGSGILPMTQKEIERWRNSSMWKSIHMSVLCRLTHNWFVILEIHPQNCHLLWDRTETVTTWSWDWSAVLHYFKQGHASLLQLQLRPDVAPMRNYEDTTEKSDTTKATTLIRAPRSTLGNSTCAWKHVEDKRRLLPVRWYACSAPITSAVKDDPQGTVISPRGGGNHLRQHQLPSVTSTNWIPNLVLQHIWFKSLQQWQTLSLAILSFEWSRAFQKRNLMGRRGVLREEDPVATNLTGPCDG